VEATFSSDLGHSGWNKVAAGRDIARRRSFARLYSSAAKA
jgi:hypothetical protein